MARNNNNRSNAKPKVMTENQRIGKQEQLTKVLLALKARRTEISDVLPNDIPFDTFFATVNQALRNNPDVLDATPVSIVNACVKAAYDGLRPDGKEAAIVTHNVNVGTKQNPQWECQAQYFPMAFGLIQQILRGGEVLSLEAEVIYQHDHYRIVRGTHRAIEHSPMVCREDGSPLEPGDRGAMILAYTVATLKSGVVVTEFLTADQILDVNMASKSGWDEQNKCPRGVWKRWPRQMWLKTIIRHHRKTLPLGERVGGRDMEAQAMFPDMHRQENPLGLEDRTNRAPPRPTRQIEDQQGTESGSAFDFGTGRREDEFQEQGQPEQEMKPAKKMETPSETNIPADDKEWAAWSQSVENDVMNAGDVKLVQQIAAEEAERLAAATPDRRNWLMGVISDRLADLASDADGKAQADGTDQNGQE